MPHPTENIGLSAGDITLQTFTPTSVNDFLHAVANAITTTVVNHAGHSPWTAATDQLKGSLTTPADDGGAPYTFATLTHLRVIRCLVAADPGNVRDLAALMQHAADNGDDVERIIALRIALRCNHSMYLNQQKKLTFADNIAPLPQREPNTPLPTTWIDPAEETINNESGAVTPINRRPTTSGAHRAPVDNEIGIASCRERV